jgi:hypothetical protein
VGEEAEKILIKLYRKSNTYSSAVSTTVPGFHLQAQVTAPEMDFLNQLQVAYVDSGIYLLQKFPLTNPLLMKLSALDPIVQGHSATAKALKGLPDLLPTCLKDDVEKKCYKEEVMKIQLDNDLPKIDDLTLDQWWSLLFPKYPTVGKVVKACLSIITSPAVERNFSIMNDVVNPKTNRLDITTVNAIMSVKSELQAKKTTTLQQYHREDKVYSPVDGPTVYHMQTSYGRYNKRLGEKKRPLKIKQAPNQSIHVRATELKKKMLMKRKSSQKSGENCHPPSKKSKKDKQTRM